MNTSHPGFRFRRVMALTAILSCGFTAVVAQLLFVRDVAAFYVANELVIGVVFALWMFFVAAGAFAAKFFVRTKNLFSFYSVLQFLSAVLPVLSVTALRLFRANMSAPGITPDFTQVMLAVVCCLGLFPFVSGMIFTVLCAFSKELKGDASAPFVYYTETAGSVIGGLLFTWVFVPVLGTYEVLLLLFLINILILSLWAFVMKKMFVALASLSLFFSALFPSWSEAGWNTLKPLFPGQHILQVSESASGTYVVTETAGQLNFFYGLSLLHTTGDQSAAEEKVHYAMLQHPVPRRVLLIAGGLSGTPEEVLKYDSVTLTCLEPAYGTFALARTHNLLPEGISEVLTADPVAFLQQHTDCFDAIIADVPEPSDMQVNRLYTIDFFKIAKKHLADGGIFSVSLAGNINYMHADARILHAMILNTLKSVFAHVALIPGGRSYFIASDEPLSFAYSELYLKHGIENVFVNPYYIDDEELALRAEHFVMSFQGDTPLNRAFNPLAPLLFYKSWLMRTGGNLYVLYGFIALIVLLTLALRGRANYAVFVAGFSGTGIELIVILSWQVLFGHVYGTIGLIIAVFMAGMATGAAAMQYFLKKIKFRHLAILLLLMAVLSALYALLPLFYSGNGAGWGLKLFLFAFIFIFAMLAGAVFTAATGISTDDKRPAAAVLYSADMLGAALAALLFSVYLIPLAGVLMSCFIITFVNVSGILILSIRNKHF